MSTLEVNKITPISGGTTVTLGDSGDTFNLASGATAGFGKIGQVKHTVGFTQQSFTSTSFIDIDDSSLSITPTSSNSKIFVLININGGFLNTSSNERMNVRVVVTPSGGSQADVAYVSRYALAAGISGGLGGETQSVTALYTPTSVVEHTFKCQIKTRHGNGCIINTNDASNVQLADNATNSTVTLMEVLP